MSKPLIGIIMGSDSDLPVMSAAADMCEKFGIDYEVTVVSAHRTPDRLVKYAKGAEKRGLRVIIAGAGGAAHLPGMVASMTALPVVGVPVKGSNLEGMDSLLSIVQMPGGVPVATVAVNGAKNAGILAAQMIGVKSKKVRKKVADYKDEMLDEVNAKIEKLEKLKYKDYLAQMPKKK
jgi:5-(carboxyamino)imidazole ribonucleotide mutase